MFSLLNYLQIKFGRNSNKYETLFIRSMQMFSYVDEIYIDSCLKNIYSVTTEKKTNNKTITKYQKE